MRATAIDHVNLRYPPDRLDDVLDFYVDALGFSPPFEDPRAAIDDDPGLFALELGATCRLFVNPSPEFDPAAANYRHVALRIDRSPAPLRAALADADVPIDHEAERERDPFGAYTSFYVEDPVGYTVELMAVGEGESG